MEQTTTIRSPRGGKAVVGLRTKRILRYTPSHAYIEMYKKRVKSFNRQYENKGIPTYVYMIKKNVNQDALTLVLTTAIFDNDVKAKG